jgi:hypothetical protein
MDDFAALYGGQTIKRLSHRSSRRQLEEEARIAGATPDPERDNGLSEHIPSPLIPLHERVRALAVGGAPAWSRRLKRIHDLTGKAHDELAEAWRALARRHWNDAGRFAAEWSQRASGFDFAQVNDLVDRHNRYFPAEANLGMDVHTRDYVGFGGGDYRLKRLDAAWIFERFPPDLAAALR